MLKNQPSLRGTKQSLHLYAGLKSSEIASFLAMTRERRFKRPPLLIFGDYSSCGVYQLQNPLYPVGISNITTVFIAIIAAHNNMIVMGGHFTG